MEAAESAQDYADDDRLQDYLEKVAVPGLMLARFDQDRGVLSRELAKEVSATFIDAVEDIWSDVERAPMDPPGVLLVANLGNLNYASTIAMSALLRLKAVPHLVLPEDAITPGKFPALDKAAVKFVCLCSLTTPSPAKLSYVAKRLAPFIGDARIINVVWDDKKDRSDVMSPVNAAALLPMVVAEILEPAQQIADTSATAALNPA